MKRNLLYLFVLFCSVSLFTSCSDDDDEVKLPIDTEVAGEYVGDLTVSVNDAPFPSIKEKITISPSTKGADQIALSLKDFTLVINVGDILVDPCAVKAIDGGYSFAGQQNIDFVAPIGTCPVGVAGTVKGSNIDIDITVKVGALNQNVKVKFVGKKLSGNESSEALIQNFKVKIGDEDVEGTIDGNRISFLIPEGLEDLTFVPTITISEKATISPASGVEQDFSSPVVYTVTSENRDVTTTYTVSISGQIRDFSFDEWEVVKSNTTGSSQEYNVPKGPYGTSNPGIMTINEMFGAFLPELYSYTVSPVEGQSGQAAQLQTVYTYMFVGGTDFNSELQGLIPYVTAGSLFTGTFETDMGNTLNSTKFGISFEREPATFSGYYKYTPGDIYYDNKNKVVADKTDQCSIYAVLYEELLDEDNNNISLTGDYNDKERYVGSSSRIIMKAALEDGTAKSEWTQFSIPFKLLDGKSYDASKNYYLAIVCSSSADGDYFKGAPGSKLLIDSFVVTSK